MALWIALTGPQISGGLPWPVPGDWNQWIGRLMFGFGGLVCWGLVPLAFRDAIGDRRR